MIVDMTTLLILALAVSGAVTAPYVLEAIGHGASGATWWPIDEAPLDSPPPKRRR